MKVHQIISESNNHLEEGPVGTIVKKLLPKKKPQGLAPSSGKARKYRDELKANKAKSAEALKKANDVARAKLEKKSSGWMTLIKAGVGLEFARQYYVDLSLLEQEYANTLADIRSGKSQMTEQQAYDAYQTQRNKLLGELTVGIAMNMRVASKAFGFLESMVKGSTAMGAGAGLIGGTAKLLGSGVALPLTVAKWLTKIVELGPLAPAFLIFMRSDYGQQFLNESYIRLITENVGDWVTAPAINALEKGLQAAGVLDADQKLPGKTDVKPPTGDAADGPRQATNGMNIQWVGKKLFIAGQQISDENGYRIVGNDKLNDIKARINVAGIPDPTLKIQDDPKKKYGVYGYDEIK